MKREKPIDCEVSTARDGTNEPVKTGEDVLEHLGEKWTLNRDNRQTEQVIFFLHFPDEVNSTELPFMNQVLWSATFCYLASLLKRQRRSLRLVSVSKGCTSLL